MDLSNPLQGNEETAEKRNTQDINYIVVQNNPLGTSGTEVYGGYFDEEYLETLKYKDKADVYDKMRRSDGQIKMLMSATKNPIRTASREIITKKDDQKYKDHVELCKRVLFEDIDFDKFLNEALTCEDFGVSVFERVHKVVQDNPILDDNGRAILNSYMSLKKLGWRSPKTIETWNFNHKTKELESIRQFVDGDLYVDVDIPINFLSIITLEMEGDNYEGISLLRPLYGNWFRKNTYLKLNAIGIEKSMPLPTAEVPAGKEGTTQYTNLINALEKFTTHQKNYLVYPAGWNIDLSNGTAYDPSKVESSIDGEDRRMAKAFLANFLELGMQGGGAYSLSNDLSDFFLSGLMVVANTIKKEIDKILKEIVILNFGKQDIYPKIEFTGIKDKAGKELAEILKMMIESKVVIPDDKLEDHVRNRYKLTPKSDEGQRIAEQNTAPDNLNNGPINFSEKIKKIVKENSKKMVE